MILTLVGLIRSFWCFVAFLFRYCQGLRILLLTAYLSLGQFLTLSKILVVFPDDCLRGTFIDNFCNLSWWVRLPYSPMVFFQD